MERMEEYKRLINLESVAFENYRQAKDRAERLRLNYLMYPESNDKNDADYAIEKAKELYRRYIDAKKTAEDYWTQL
jgi:hypothetical protein